MGEISQIPKFMVEAKKSITHFEADQIRISLYCFFRSHKDNEPSKTNKLALHGDQFLEGFQTARDEGVCEAIKAYERVSDCLPVGDPTFPYDIAIGHQARYARFGWLGDLEKAFTKREHAVAVTAEEDVNYPPLSSLSYYLGASLSLRPESIARLDGTSEAIRNQERAIQFTPDGHSFLPAYLNKFAFSFSSRFEHIGYLLDVSEAIRNQQRAVQLTLEGHADLPGHPGNLGTFHFKYAGEPEDPFEAIRNQRPALQLIPEGHANMLGWLNDLGNSFLSRFEHSGKLEDVSGAIRIQQHAVRLTPGGRTLLSAYLTNLGNSFVRRFEHTGDLDDVSKAIQIQKRTVQLIPDGDAVLPACLNNLGISFSNCFEHTGDSNDVSEAIRRQQRAVQLTPEGRAALPGRLCNLGSSFRCRLMRTGDLEDISEAIRNQQQAIQLNPDGHADILSNLGKSFWRRFQRTGDLDDISKAIRSQQRAIQLTPEGHAALPGRLCNLGNSFRYRFKRTRDLEDISEAIRNQQRAIQLNPDGHADMPGFLSNLGKSFWRRFQRTGDLDDISEAIRNQQHAIQLTPEGHANLPACLNNLGLSFSSRFERTGDLHDISEAIRIHRRAVLLAPEGHADLPACLNNLGRSFWCRFQRTGNPEDIAEAIRNQQRAVQLTPDGHADKPGFFYALGKSFNSHFECTRNHESLSAAVLNYRLSATSSSGPSSVRLSAAKNWATLSQQPFFSLSELLEAHACIIHLVSLTSGLENTIQRRHKTLAHSSESQLSIAASAVALSCSCPDKALEWLVEGRCIVWNQINQLRTPVDELRSHDPALAKRLSVLSRELQDAGLRTDSRRKQTELSMDDKISLENEEGMHIKHAKDWEQLLNTIRNIPQFKDFLRPRKCADIMSSLPKKGPIVIINIHRDRCDALALMAGADEPRHIPLPMFSYQEAERLANDLRGYLLSFDVRSRRGMRLCNQSPLSGDDFPVLLKVLWSNVVSPILEALTFSVCSASIFHLWFSLNIVFRYLVLMQSSPAYGGAQLAHLLSFQSMQQVSTSRERAFLGNTCRNLLSHHIFQP